MKAAQDLPTDKVISKINLALLIEYNTAKSQ
jgi:hypothetical protein